MKMPEEDGIVHIPSWLLRKIEKRVQQTEFKSSSEYVTYVMTQVVSEQEKGAPLSDKEETKVKDRLKALGYL